MGEARRPVWCEHELMYHIFEFGVPEGLRSMEAHMKALASVGESSESVLQGRRFLELADSVVFPGGVLQEDNSVNESSSSSWQWPWAASGEINMWNPLLVLIPVKGLRNTWFDSGYIFFISLWMALEEFQVFLRGWVDSDPEVVSCRFSPCGHARRQQRQWHACSTSCLTPGFTLDALTQSSHVFAW